MYKPAFENLLVHVPQMLEVRFHLPNLMRAVEQRIASEVLSSWQSEETGVVDSSLDATLARAGLVPAATQRYAVTRLGDQLLRDRFGARLDESLGETYRRAGLVATLRRINGLNDGSLNQQRIDQLSSEAVQQLMSELRHAASFALHEQALSDLTSRLSNLSEEVLAQVARNAERRRQLQHNYEREQQARSAAPPVDAAPPNPPAPPVKWYEWRPRRGTPQATPTPRPTPPHIPRGGDETLLWEAALRQVVLEGEAHLLGAINSALTDELATDAQSLALISEGARVTETTAQASESVRDWGLAAGEILLNGPDLTGAVMRRLWPDRGGLHTLIFSKYAAAGNDAETTLTDEIVTPETIDGINNVVNEIVTRELSEWTITDALAALSASDSDMLRRIEDAFRQSTERDFLATGHDHILPRANYAVITCAPSKLAAANSFFTNWVESFSQTADIEFEVEADAMLTDCLCCYLENFSVPLSAMRFCEDYVEDESGQDPAAAPIFTPHPDILPANIHPAPVSVSGKRVNVEEESEGPNVAD